MNQVASVSVIARIRGWLLVVLGAALGLAGAAFVIYLTSIIAHTDQSGGTRWTGSHDMTVRVFQLFGAVIVFGVVAVAGGMFQLRRGRPSWSAMIILLMLVGVMYFLGQQIMAPAR
jgi:hypothetical protein